MSSVAYYEGSLEKSFPSLDPSSLSLVAFIPALASLSLTAHHLQ